MTTKTKYFVKYYYQGLMVGETSVLELDGPMFALDIDIPDGAYAFKLITQDLIIDDRGEEYAGEMKEISKIIYHEDSKITTYDEVALMPAEKRGPHLLSNMKMNGWESVIWTRWGSWPQPYNPETMEIR